MWLFLKNLLFTLLLPGTVAVYLPLLIAGRSGDASAFQVAAAAILFAIGGSIYLWCLWDFATFGRGTPAPIDAPKKLVVRGLYRYTRNPMYVGILTIILGWLALFTTGWLLLYAAIVGTVFHLFIVYYEEPHLKKLFGGQYEEYCKEVGRWLPRYATRR